MKLNQTSVIPATGGWLPVASVHLLKVDLRAAGLIAGIRPAQKDLRHTHSRLAVAVSPVKLQEAARTREPLTNPVTLV